MLLKQACSFPFSHGKKLAVWTISGAEETTAVPFLSTPGLRNFLTPQPNFLRQKKKKAVVQEVGSLGGSHHPLCLGGRFLLQHGLWLFDLD